MFKGMLLREVVYFKKYIRFSILFLVKGKYYLNYLFIKDKKYSYVLKNVNWDLMLINISLDILRSIW